MTFRHSLNSFGVLICCGFSARRLDFWTEHLEAAPSATTLCSTTGLGSCPPSRGRSRGARRSWRKKYTRRVLAFPFHHAFEIQTLGGREQHGVVRFSGSPILALGLGPGVARRSGRGFGNDAGVGSPFGGHTERDLRDHAGGVRVRGLRSPRDDARQPRLHQLFGSAAQAEMCSLHARTAMARRARRLALLWPAVLAATAAAMRVANPSTIGADLLVRAAGSCDMSVPWRLANRSSFDARWLTQVLGAAFPWRAGLGGDSKRPELPGGHRLGFALFPLGPNSVEIAMGHAGAESGIGGHATAERGKLVGPMSHRTRTHRKCQLSTSSHRQCVEPMFQYNTSPLGDWTLREFPGGHRCTIASVPGFALSPLGAAPAKLFSGQKFSRDPKFSSATMFIAQNLTQTPTILGFWPILSEFGQFWRNLDQFRRNQPILERLRPISSRSTDSGARVLVQFPARFAAAQTQSWSAFGRFPARCGQLPAMSTNSGRVRPIFGANSANVGA